ncbi:MAG: EscU/YscU/HrcU family type III secretion system export apparatus switch protein [Candidatus Margulisiibacteriota bacterium]|jgi:flagellar biosynthesis protein
MPVDNRENIQEQIDKEMDDRSKKVAVALNYNIDKPESAPLITALGKGELAQEIIKIAEENSIPLYEDRALASLLSKLEMDTEVPQELYILVAEVLAFVYKLDRMARKRESVEEEIQRRPQK